MIDQDRFNKTMLHLYLAGLPAGSVLFDVLNTIYAGHPPSEIMQAMGTTMACMGNPEFGRQMRTVVAMEMLCSLDPIGGPAPPEVRRQ